MVRVMLSVVLWLGNCQSRRPLDSTVGAERAIPTADAVFLTGAQLRVMRLQLSDLAAKLRQMTAVERDRRR
jgi:hypothetical protein